MMGLVTTKRGVVMNIAVFGTGMVGRALSAKLVELGHAVTIGTRDVEALLARKESDGMGNPPFAVWQAENTAVQVGTFAEAAAGSELLVNATSGQATLTVLKSAGEKNLNGKVLLDIANPLDFSQGMPPTLSIVNTDSLAEQIQQAFPELKVVKTLNTMSAPVMIDPQAVGDGDHTVFVSGNDAAAKEETAVLLRSFGWEQIVDLGDITTARGTEMLLPIWLRLYGALQTPLFNFKVVQ